MKPVMGFMFLALLFAIPRVAQAQEPATQLATKVQGPDKVPEAPKVESAGISAEVESLAEVQKALGAEPQAADDAPSAPPPLTAPESFEATTTR